MPSKKPSPVQKSTARMQPIRATQPFQLLHGSPARKSPSSSPTPRSTADPRVSVRNWWQSDHRSSPDRSERRSPNSPSVKMSNRRSPSPSIRKTSSLDSIAVPYLTGQWPRDNYISTYQHVMRDKTTQTSDADWNNDNYNKILQMKSSSKASRSSIADPDFKQMRKQLRTIAKRNNDKKARSPPVHGNHAALHQLPAPHSRSNPISIGNQAFGKTPRRQNSNEALNKEIEFISNSSSISGEPRHLQGITPPDGHRAPFPRCSTRTMETQTSQDIPYGVEHPREDNESAESFNSPSSSPAEPLQQSLLPNTLRNSTDFEAKEYGISPHPKYASSPRPNNSFMFKREPPEGAESVKPLIEQDTRQRVFASCPDMKKNNFNKSKLSAFTPPPPKLLIPTLSVAVLNSEQDGSSGMLHAPIATSIVVNTNNNSNTSNNGSSSLTHNNSNTFSPIPFVNATMSVVSGDA